MSHATLIAALILTSLSTSGEAPAPKELYRQHRWFDLQEAIKGSEAPPLYRGALASAFNDVTGAEKFLNQTIKLAPDSSDAEAAHEALANLYVRAGRYKQAVRQLDEALRIKPGNPDAENARVLFAAWSKHPDQSVGTVRSGQIHADIRNETVLLPLSIRGKTIQWFLDTGANFSMMSESEAGSLAVAIADSASKVADSVGGTTSMRTAVVDELSIGKVHLRNVAFLILPDSQEPMSDLQPGRRGLIGLPVAIALRSIGWNSNGTFTIGSASGRPKKGRKNLCFDDLTPVTRVEFDDKELDFSLDSGDQSGSQLWSRFASEFAPLLNQLGKKGTEKVTMVGGSNERETIILPELQLRVGGLKTTLRPARVSPYLSATIIITDYLGWICLVKPVKCG